MKKIIFLTLLFVWTTANSSFANQYLIENGGSIELPAQQNIWIENKKTIKASIHGSRVRLLGLNPGASLIRVGKDLHKIDVMDNLAFANQSNIEKSTAKAVKLSMVVVDGSIEIKGTLFSMEEYLEILKNSNGASFSMAVQIRDELKLKVQKYLNSKLENENLSTQTILFNTNWQIRIPQKHPDLNRYNEILSKLGIRVATDESSLETKPLINIRITVAEIRKDHIKKWGLRWPSNYSASLLPEGTWQRSEAIFSAEALESSGVGKILASPRLLARSGSEASFFAGGELPIKIINYKYQSIEWKSYGIQLKILPTADSSGRMNIKIETEISSIDESRKVDDIPGFTRNKVSSQFDLLRTQTIVLSGLIKNEQSKQSEGLPGLSNIPILGSLFASKDFQNSQSELVVLVRPEIISAEFMQPQYQSDNVHLNGEIQ